MTLTTVSHGAPGSVCIDRLRKQPWRYAGPFQGTETRRRDSLKTQCVLKLISELRSTAFVPRAVFPVFDRSFGRGKRDVARPIRKPHYPHAAPGERNGPNVTDFRY